MGSYEILKKYSLKYLLTLFCIGVLMDSVIGLTYQQTFKKRTIHSVLRSANIPDIKEVIRNIAQQNSKIEHQDGFKGDFNKFYYPQIKSAMFQQTIISNSFKDDDLYPIDEQIVKQHMKLNPRNIVRRSLSSNLEKTSLIHDANLPKKNSSLSETQSQQKFSTQTYHSSRMSPSDVLSSVPSKDILYSSGDSPLEDASHLVTGNTAVHSTAITNRMASSAQPVLAAQQATSTQSAVSQTTLHSMLKTVNNNSVIPMFSQRLSSKSSSLLSSTKTSSTIASNITSAMPLLISSSTESVSSHALSTSIATITQMPVHSPKQTSLTRQFSEHEMAAHLIEFKTVSLTPLAIPEPEPTSDMLASGTPEPVSGTPEPGTPEPASGTPEPASGIPEPASGTPEPISGTPEPGTPEPASGTPEPASGTPEPVSGSPEPGTPEPASGTPEPASGTPEPVLGSPEPASGTPEPVSGSPEPASGTPEPASGTPEPISGSPEPGTPEPGLRTPEPASGTPEQGLGTPEPTIDRRKSGTAEPTIGVSRSESRTPIATPELTGDTQTPRPKAEPTDKNISFVTPASPSVRHTYAGDAEPTAEGETSPKTEPEPADYDAFAEPVPDWSKAKVEWDIAWEIHIYLTGVLFAIIALYSLLSILRLWHMKNLFSQKYFITLNMLMFITGLFRAVYLLVDAYNANKTFPAILNYFLYSTGFPCLTSAFAILFYALLRATQMQLVTPRIQKLKFLVSVIVFHFLLFTVTDVVVGLVYSAKIMFLVCEVFSIIWGLFLIIGYFYVFRRIFASALKRQRLLNRLSTVKTISSTGNRMSPLNVSVISESPKSSRYTLGLAIRVTLITAIFSIMYIGVHIYGIVDVYGVLQHEPPKPWPWWIVMFCLRMTELCMCLTMSYVATQPFRYAKKGEMLSCCFYLATCKNLLLPYRFEKKPEKDIEWEEIDQSFMQVPHNSEIANEKYLYATCKSTETYDLNSIENAATLEVRPVVTNLNGHANFSMDAQQEEDKDGSDAISRPQSMLVMEDGRFRFPTDDELVSMGHNEDEDMRNMSIVSDSHLAKQARKEKRKLRPAFISDSKLLRHKHKPAKDSFQIAHEWSHENLRTDPEPTVLDIDSAQQTPIISSFSDNFEREFNKLLGHQTECSSCSSDVPESKKDCTLKVLPSDNKNNSCLADTSKLKQPLISQSSVTWDKKPSPLLRSNSDHLSCGKIRTKQFNKLKYLSLSDLQLQLSASSNRQWLYEKDSVRPGTDLATRSLSDLQKISDFDALYQDREAPYDIWDSKLNYSEC